ncbi:MAG: DUF6515 family protein [Nostoc sp.]|uniref:DUF6515 family protein n=1 Tax=Nostoc sp. TaxID=1180 RepID=UPI002FF862B5
MKFSTHQTFLALILALLSASALPLDAVYAQRPSNGNVNRTGASFRVNSRVNLQNRGNINPGNVNRSNINPGNVNRSNINPGNVNRPNINPRNVNRPNINPRNVNRPNINPRNVNRPNINPGNVKLRNTVNVRRAIPQGGRFGGGWNGHGYDTPSGWGLATFASGLVIGGIINTLPPYYIPIDVGSTNYIYSDGVFLQPSGNSYIVTKPPIGAVVPFLPDGCTAINMGRLVYYNCSGIIYQPFYQGSNLVYKVVQY